MRSRLARAAVAAASLVGVGGLVPGALASPAAAAFPDVPIRAYFAEAVDWLVTSSITTGVGDTGRYAPDEPVSRGQMATMLWRLMGEPAAGGRPPFSDVPAGSYFAEAVTWLAGEGITTGVGEGRFDPAAHVTRGQMATFLHRLAGRPAPGDARRFADVHARSYAADAVRWMAANAITTGIGGTDRFAPDEVVTRGQTASFILRLTSRPGAWSTRADLAVGPGEHAVGRAVPAGRYRTLDDRPGCAWTRKAAGVEARRYTAVDTVVDVARDDRSLRVAAACGPLLETDDPVTASPSRPFGPGTYVVGTDVAPGRWEAPGGPGCHWERLSGFGGGPGDVVDEDFRTDRGSVTVEIEPGDAGFSADPACGTWKRAG